MLPTSLVTLAAVPVTAAAEEGSLFWLIFFAFVAIGFSFFCSIAEAVLLSVSPSYIAVLKEEGQRSAERLAALKANIDRPLSAILSLNTVAHTVGAAGVGAQAASIWGNQAVGWASAAMTLLILFLSEIIPKTIGAVYWRTLAPAIATLTQLLVWLLLPLVWLSELFTKLIGGSHQHVVTREEVAALAEIGAKSGQLDPGESKILVNLFRLGKLRVQDIMTPRTVVIALPEEHTVGEVVAQQPDLPVSRIPVYDESIDGVTGFVLRSDILLRAHDQPDATLATLRREIQTVPSSAKLTALFDLLLKSGEHIALVLDEYGGTDGLVTLEDLIETLLGTEIVDEADTATDMRRVARQRWKKRAAALGLDTHRVSDSNEAPNQQPE
ncbi:MAG: CNNM domain-containing protein [Planctomycetota bacterium]